MVKVFQAVSNANFWGLSVFGTGPDVFTKRSLPLVCLFKEKQAQCFHKFPSRFCLALVQCILWPSLGLRLLLPFARFLVFGFLHLVLTESVLSLAFIVLAKSFLTSWGRHSKGPC